MPPVCTLRFYFGGDDAPVTVGRRLDFWLTCVARRQRRPPPVSPSAQL